MSNVSATYSDVILLLAAMKTFLRDKLAAHCAADCI